MKHFPESEFIINADGSVFHLHLQPEQLRDKIILVGDPGRVDLVASFFDTREFEVSSREFHTIGGTYKGKSVMCLSHGIGTDNIDIVVNELDALANIDFSTRYEKPQFRQLTLVRVGTSGGLQPHVPIGTPVIAEKSIGFDGVLNFYAGRDMVRGVTISANGFYGPQGRELRIPLADPELNKKIEAFKYGSQVVTNYEMESSALAGLAKLMGHKAMTVCSIIANRVAHHANPNYKTAVSDLIQTVLERI